MGLLAKLKPKRHASPKKLSERDQWLKDYAEGKVQKLEVEHSPEKKSKQKEVKK